MTKLCSWFFFICTYSYLPATTFIVSVDVHSLRISQAIERSKDGDTIQLMKGVYKEKNIVCTKSLSICGNQSILDGENRYEILTVSGHHFHIEGIEFRNSGYSSLNDYAALKIIDAHHFEIVDNKFTNSYFAIHINNSNNGLIQNNTIQGASKTEQSSGNGIHLWKCHDMTIQSNRIAGQRDGIYFEFVTQSKILSNYSTQNVRYGLHFMYSSYDEYRNNEFVHNGAGVAVMYSQHVRMLQNKFIENWGASAYGILLKDISDGSISQNTFTGNTVALHLEGVSRMMIDQNKFNSNGWGIKIQASCTDNEFTKNNFSQNTFDVTTNSTLSLNSFDQNYWDQYTGYDLNKDGYGDIPFRPVNLYATIVEKYDFSILFLKSFIVHLLNQAEKIIPSVTPTDLVDHRPIIKPYPL